ncbi:MAG: hypothetical protein KF685_07855 [Acidobacteria bacterium]|nr:hypothetical protein [Acidobacteriota bacterium]
MRNIVLAILCISIITFGNSTVYSQCGSCIENYFSVYDEFSGSKAVFVGKVIEIKKIEESRNTDTTTNTDYYQFKVIFEIGTAWKTDLPETIIITNTSSKNSDFKLGESYLVYASVRHYDKENLRAHTGCCSRTKLLSDAKEDLQEFKNKGEKPAKIIKVSHEDNDNLNGFLDLRAKQRFSFRVAWFPLACS